MVKSSGADKINQEDLQGTLHKMPILHRYFAKTDSEPSLWLEYGQETTPDGTSSPKGHRTLSGSTKNYSTGIYLAVASATQECSQSSDGSIAAAAVCRWHKAG